jgi:hypothetical protein
MRETTVQTIKRRFHLDMSCCRIILVRIRGDKSLVLFAIALIKSALGAYFWLLERTYAVIFDCEWPPPPGLLILGNSGIQDNSGICRSQSSGDHKHDKDLYSEPQSSWKTLICQKNWNLIQGWNDHSTVSMATWLLVADTWIRESKTIERKFHCKTID